MNWRDLQNLAMARRVLCLDWDKRWLRVLVAKIGGGSVDLEDAHSFRLPAGLDVEDPGTLGEFIARCLAEKNIRQRQAVVDIPRDRAVINRLTLPPTPLDELPSAVRFQAIKELPFPPEEAAIDYVVLEQQGSAATAVLLAAVRLETLDRVRATCLAARLEPVRVGLRPYANLMGLRELPQVRGSRVLFADVGPSMTEIDVFREGQLAFSRSASVSVPFAAGDLASDDSRVSSKADVTGLALEEELHADAVNELMVEMTRTLQAYRASEADARIDQIVIGGATGVETALALAVEKRFSLPTAIYDPTPVLGVRGEEASKLRSFAAVVGLARGMGREGQLEIDFLNPKRPVPRGQVLRQRVRMYALAAGVLAALGLGWVARDWLLLSRELERLRDINADLSQHVREMVEIDIRSLEVADWRKEAELTVWLDHLLQLTRSAIDPGKRMLVTNMVLTGGSRAAATINVSAADADVVGSLVEQLNAIEEGGRRIYNAVQGTWQDSPSADGKFRGTVDVTVELLRVRELMDDAAIKRRAQDRARLLNL